MPKIIPDNIGNEELRKNLFDSIMNYLDLGELEKANNTFVNLNLSIRKILATMRTGEDVTLLHRAVFCGEADLATQLILSGANVEQETLNGIRPLHYAALSTSTNSVTIMSDLLNLYNAIPEPFANVNLPFCGYPLHMAIMDNETSLAKVQLLLSKGADVNRQNREGSTPLHCAVELCKTNPQLALEITKYLIEKNASLDKGLNVENSSFPLTPILFALNNGYTDMVLFLFDEAKKKFPNQHPFGMVAGFIPKAISRKISTLFWKIQGSNGELIARLWDDAIRTNDLGRTQMMQGQLQIWVSSLRSLKSLATTGVASSFERLAAECASQQQDNLQVLLMACDANIRETRGLLNELSGILPRQAI